MLLALREHSILAWLVKNSPTGYRESRRHHLALTTGCGPQQTPIKTPTIESLLYLLPTPKYLAFLLICNTLATPDDRHLFEWQRHISKSLVGAQQPSLLVIHAVLFEIVTRHMRLPRLNALIKWS